MGAVAYLPWIHFDKDFQAGNYEFLRCDNRNIPLTGLPNPWDQIIDVTRNKNNSPINRFTIVKKINGTFIDDFTENEIRELYKIVEMLALVGISTRDISGHDYVNTENFNLYIQRFDQVPIQHLHIMSRRRGSTMWNGMPIGMYRLRCPENVSTKYNNKLDIDFFNALTSYVMNGRSGHERIFDSIENFNLANTDYIRVRENSEFVLLCGAFERLLRSSGSAQRLRFKVHRAINFVPKQNVGSCQKSLPFRPSTIKGWCSRLTGGYIKTDNAFDTCHELRDFWIIDFYKMRNKYAHGGRGYNDNIWSAEEHLVLSSHIFPLLIKIYLRDQRAFTLRPFEDNRPLYFFDFFLIRDDLLVEDQNFDTGWGKARMDAVMSHSGNFRIV
jgi:hypothetical protein